MKPYIFPSSIETARALILHLVKLMLDEPDRTFCIAFSGGSTPALMFDLWANEYTDITPWERLKVFWVDERCVPPENSDSNYCTYSVRECVSNTGGEESEEGGCPLFEAGDERSAGGE